MRNKPPKGKYCDKCSKIAHSPWECYCGKYYHSLFNARWLFWHIVKCDPCLKETEKK